MLGIYRWMARVEAKLDRLLSQEGIEVADLKEINAKADQVLADETRIKTDLGALVAQQKFNAQTVLDLQAKLDAAQGDPQVLAGVSAKLTQLHGDMTDTASAMEAMIPAVTSTTVPVTGTVGGSGTGTSGSDTSAGTGAGGVAPSSEGVPPTT